MGTCLPNQKRIATDHFVQVTARDETDCGPEHVVITAFPVSANG